MTLDALYKIIKNRKDYMPKNSYITSLFKAGKNRIRQKVGEEAVEVIIAADEKTNKRLIEEMADLWFHSLVLLVASDISLKEIFSELGRRQKKENML